MFGGAEMAGRKPKLNDAKKGHRTKEELEQAELKENGLQQFTKINVDTVPEGLTENAAKEWLRVVPLLEQLPIAELDYSLIKKYCEVLDQNDTLYRSISEKNGIEGMVDPESNRKTGAFMAYMESLKELRSICGQLGMTIDSRMRLVVPTESEVKKSVYDEFGVGDDD
jgi:P27 family predicted phage terminase small subunit